jgi:hypothetical protein
MMQLLKIAAGPLLCACFAVVQTPATAQTFTMSPQAGTEVTKPVLEFANTNQAKIAWTSKQGANLGLHYGPILTTLPGRSMPLRNLAATTTARLSSTCSPIPPTTSK